MTLWLTRKLASTCAQAGCTEPPCEDNCLCRKHRDEHRERNRTSMQRRRLFRRVQQAWTW